MKASAVQYQSLCGDTSLMTSCLVARNDRILVGLLVVAICYHTSKLWYYLSFLVEILLLHLASIGDKCPV